MIKILYIENNKKFYSDIPELLSDYEIEATVIKNFLKIKDLSEAKLNSFNLLLYNLSPKEISNFMFIKKIENFIERYPNISLLFLVEKNDFSDLDYEYMINYNYIFKNSGIEVLAQKIKNIANLNYKDNYKLTNLYQHIENLLETSKKATFKKTEPEYENTCEYENIGEEESILPEKIIENIYKKLMYNNDKEHNRIYMNIENKIKNLNIIVDTKYFYSALEEIFININKYINSNIKNPMNIKLITVNQRIQFVISHKNLSVNIIDKIKKISFINKVFELHGIKTGLLYENKTNSYIIRIPKYRTSYKKKELYLNADY